MTAALASSPGRCGPLDVAAFEVGWVSEDGVEHRVPLLKAWTVPFESGLPVRRFPARKGQPHLSGLWWCATTGDHVGFESWLERDELVLLDFDPAVTALASQPFWLRLVDDVGDPVEHAPDYFARLVDGSALVVDCRPEQRRPPRDLAKFAATARACELLGWQYRLVGGTDPVLTANLRWLAGYRHPRHHVAGTVERLRSVFETPTPLMDGAATAGDPLGVLPVLFHLLWSQELSVEVSVPLHARALVANREMA